MTLDSTLINCPQCHDEFGSEGLTITQDGHVVAVVMRCIICGRSVHTDVASCGGDETAAWKAVAEKWNLPSVEVHENVLAKIETDKFPGVRL